MKNFIYFVLFCLILPCSVCQAAYKKTYTGCQYSIDPSGATYYSHNWNEPYTPVSTPEAITGDHALLLIFADSLSSSKIMNMELECYQTISGSDRITKEIPMVMGPGGKSVSMEHFFLPKWNDSTTYVYKLKGASLYIQSLIPGVPKGPNFMGVDTIMHLIPDKHKDRIISMRFLGSKAAAAEYQENIIRAINSIQFINAGPSNAPSPEPSPEPSPVPYPMPSPDEETPEYDFQDIENDLCLHNIAVPESFIASEDGKAYQAGNLTAKGSSIRLLFIDTQNGGNIYLISTCTLSTSKPVGEIIPDILDEGVKIAPADDVLFPEQNDKTCYLYEGSDWSAYMLASSDAPDAGYAAVMYIVPQKYKYLTVKVKLSADGEVLKERGEDVLKAIKNIRF